ncbi:MAG: glycine--tRNA ligase subunit beta, partial [Prochlorococcus sp.]
MSTFLLEIGTEELPADFARLALPQLEQMVDRDLQSLRLSYGKIHCTSTPRRLVVLVEDLASAAEDLEEVRKGPPAGQAFKNDVPTQAAIGFAKRCGLPPEALELRDTPKGAFVFAKVLERGRPAIELLPQQILAWIGCLQGRRFMRWGDGERRFSRPIRWLVALLD